MQNLVMLVHPLTPQTLFDSHSFIKCEFEQQKQNFNFLNVPNLSLTLSCFNIIQIQKFPQGSKTEETKDITR